MDQEMNENLNENNSEGFEDLKEFYTQKKNEQEALRRLLEALESASKTEKTDDNLNNKQQKF
jgi:predicted RNase H-like HicB family nuclease